MKNLIFQIRPSSKAVGIRSNQVECHHGEYINEVQKRLERLHLILECLFLNRSALQNDSMSSEIREQETILQGFYFKQLKQEKERIQLLLLMSKEGM